MIFDKFSPKVFMPSTKVLRATNFRRGAEEETYCK